MKYKNFLGDSLSTLGLGTMRLPTLSENNSEIDIAKTSEMIDFAIKNGINYFDTAWIYHGGNSESVIGEILSKYPRESYRLATKFPGFEVGQAENKEKIFEKQLEKCKVDYFDYYLFHNVCERNIGWFTDEKYGLFNYLMEMKKKGKIRHLGFSTHGSLHTIKAFLDKYGKDLEFCQIQLNYFDYKYQNAKAKVELLSRYGKPIWVMEPLRGGMLANPKDEYKAELSKIRENETAPALAFRFLQSFSEVAVTLSGMSNMEQLRENISTFSNFTPLTKSEMEGVLKIADSMIASSEIHCTSCRYCLEKCPKNIQIPEIMAIYNRYKKGEKNALETPLLPSECVGCRACEGACPQGIKISEIIKNLNFEH